MRMIRHWLFTFILSFLPLWGFADEAKWYQVEVLVFEQNGATMRSGNDIALKNYREATLLNQQPQKFRMLTEKDSQIVDVKNRMKKKYPILTHAVWSQVLEAKPESAPVLIEQGNLQGLIRVSGGKTLHVNTDITLDKGDGRYHVKDSSKIHLNDIHYIDHPRMGIIIRVKAA